MDLTFGIVSDFKNLDFLSKIIESIENMNIPNYEIIIVGDSKIYLNDNKYCKIISYKDKNIKGDISIKKNLITDNAKYDMIVYLHDYIIFDDKWYRGYEKFGWNFNISMNIIENNDGTRYRDWCLWCEDANKYVCNNNYLLSYDIRHLSKMMYISGAYWVSRKSFMLENKLNEKLSWGQGEDVEWSIRVRKHTEFVFNEYSKVRLLKYKDRIFNDINEKEIDILKNIKNYDDSMSYDILIENHLKKWI